MKPWEMLSWFTNNAQFRLLEADSRKIQGHVNSRCIRLPRAALFIIVEDWKQPKYSLTDI